MKKFKLIVSNSVFNKNKKTEVYFCFDDVMETYAEKIGTLLSGSEAEEITDFNWVDYFTGEQLGLAVLKFLGENNCDQKNFLKFSFRKTYEGIKCFFSLRGNFKK